MRKVEKNILEIKEDVKIGDVILEAGDKIQILEGTNKQLAIDICAGIDAKGVYFAVYYDQRDDSILVDSAMGASSTDINKVFSVIKKLGAMDLVANFKIIVADVPSSTAKQITRIPFPE